MYFLVRDRFPKPPVPTSPVLHGKAAQIEYVPFSIYFLLVTYWNFAPKNFEPKNFAQNIPPPKQILATKLFNGKKPKEKKITLRKKCVKA